MSAAGACNCTQAVELQAELDRARVRISNLEYQNSNLRGRLDDAERRAGAAHTPGGGQLPDEGGPAPGGAGTTRPAAAAVASPTPKELDAAERNHGCGHCNHWWQGGPCCSCDTPIRGE